MYNMEEISINSFSLFAYNLQKKLLRNHKLKSKGRFHCIDINAGDCTKVNFFSTFRFLSVLNHLSRSMALNLPSVPGVKGPDLMNGHAWLNCADVGQPLLSSLNR